MKFLFHIPQLIFGGAEKVLVSFANDLVNRGHEVEILESYEKGLLKDQFDSRVNFNAICSVAYTKKYYASLDEIKEEKNIFKKSGKCFKKLFSQIVGYRRYAEKLAAKHYRSRQYDVAINYLEIESPEFILKNINAKKHLQWFHADISGLSDTSETDSFVQHYANTDAVICVSESAKANFVKHYPHLAEKTHVMYNFFDSKSITEKSLQSFDFGLQKPVLLSVGRMTEQKAYPRFIKILKRLSDDGYEFSYHILGDGSQRAEIEKLISDLNMSNTVTLHGLTDNPYKYISACDLFVLPSVWEAFPTVTVEAKILKKPVLATDVSGVREQIVHGKTGYITENTENALYEGLKQLLSNPSYMSSLSDNTGIEKICDNSYKYEQFMSLCNL